MTINWQLKASLEMQSSVMAKCKLETLMAEIEAQPGDPQLAREQIFSFITDLRALLGVIEAVYTLDTAMLSHPHGMPPEVRKQRNALLALPRKLCRAEAIQRWAALDGRWEPFVKAMDTTS